MEVRKAGHCKDKAVRLEITQNSNLWESNLSRESHQYQRMGEWGSTDKRSEKTGFVTFMVTYPCGKNTKADWAGALSKGRRPKLGLDMQEAGVGTMRWTPQKSLSGR